MFFFCKRNKQQGYFIPSNILLSIQSFGPDILMLLLVTQISPKTGPLLSLFSYSLSFLHVILYSSLLNITLFSYLIYIYFSYVV